MSDLLSGLNPQQLHAVTAGPGPTLVVAGPGSGKTRVLAHRIAYLIHRGAPPYRIMAVTFTNKAAREMRERVEGLLGGALGGLTLGTFHAICARFLRREAERLKVTRDFVIFDDSDQLAIVRQAMERLKLDEKHYRPQALLAAISKAKNEVITPAEYRAETYFNEMAGRVYAEYQKLLLENNALDFDDLLMGAVLLFRDNPEVLKKYQAHYEHVLVDEFQDTNTAQYILLQQLTAARRNLYVVGDPDQSVYRWRGADYRNVRRFQDDHPDALTVLLEQNYRSTQLILDAAMSVIDKNAGRTRKRLRAAAERAGGVKIQVYEAYNEEEEAQYIVEMIALLAKRENLNPGEAAIMYRTNAQSRPIEDAFIRANLPYRLVGATRFYARREVKDVLAFLRLVHNPADSVSLRRVINVPPRGLGAKTLDALQQAADNAGLSPSAILRDLGAERGASDYAKTFSGRASAALIDFGQMLNGWIAAKESLTVAQLMDRILGETDYRLYVNDGTEEGEERWGNVLELRSVAAENPEQDLAAFLEDVALVSDVDNLSEDSAGPTLLTLHAAKGLEFSVVFITGLDDGVLPHQRSFEDAEEMAEERRLMYVGLTRAKERLFLTRAFRRGMYGDYSVTLPSRFLEDIPDELLTGHVTHSKHDDGSAYLRATTWESPLRAAPRGGGRSGGRTAGSQTRPDVPEGRYRTGQRVRHAAFGEGLIIESRGSGGDEIVVVAFEGVGVKRLDAELADLKILI